MNRRAALVAALLLAAVGAAAEITSQGSVPSGSDGQLQYNSAYDFAGVPGSSIHGSTVVVAQVEASTATFGATKKSTFSYDGSLKMGADIDLGGNVIKNGSGAALSGIPSTAAVSVVDIASVARDTLLGAATHTLDLARIALETSTGTLQAETTQLRIDTGTLKAADLVLAEALNSTASALTSEINRATTAEASKVAKTGDTMTGQLTLSGSSLTVIGSGETPGTLDLVNQSAGGFGSAIGRQCFSNRDGGDVVVASACIQGLRDEGGSGIGLRFDLQSAGDTQKPRLWLDSYGNLMLSTWSYLYSMPTGYKLFVDHGGIHVNDGDLRLQAGDSYGGHINWAIKGSTATAAELYLDGVQTLRYRVRNQIATNFGLEAADGDLETDEREATWFQSRGDGKGNIEALELYNIGYNGVGQRRMGLNIVRVGTGQWRDFWISHSGEGTSETPLFAVQADSHVAIYNNLYLSKGLASGSTYYADSGYFVLVGTVSALRFLGDGSYLTGIPSTASIVGVYLPLTGGTLTGTLNSNVTGPSYGMSITAPGGVTGGGGILLTPDINNATWVPLAMKDIYGRNALQFNQNGDAHFGVAGASVGIRQPTPTEALDVVGNVKVSGTISGTVTPGSVDLSTSASRMEALETQDAAHSIATSTHGATDQAAASRMVLRDSAGGAAFGSVTASSGTYTTGIKIIGPMISSNTGNSLDQGLALYSTPTGYSGSIVAANGTMYFLSNTGAQIFNLSPNKMSFGTTPGAISMGGGRISNTGNTGGLTFASDAAASFSGDLAVTGNAFSVGGSTLVVAGSRVMINRASTYFDGLDIGSKYSRTDTTVRPLFQLSTNETYPDAAFTFYAGLKGASSSANRTAVLQTSTYGIDELGNIALQPNNGKVGIGTLAPASTLHVNGSAQFGSGATNSTFTAAGFWEPVSHSKAEIDLLVPAKSSGDYIFCSDCTIPSLCVSSGTLAGQWRKEGTASTGCGTNE